MGFSQIKWVFLKNPENVGFSQIKWGFLNKSTLSADVGFFQKNPVYLRETHIICTCRERWVYWKNGLYLHMHLCTKIPKKLTLFSRTDNVGFCPINQVFSEKPTLPADNVGFFRETYFIWKKPILSDLIMWVFQKNALYLRETHIICRYSTGHSQHNMLKTLTNSYEWIWSFANKNEVRVNEFVKTKLPLHFYFVKTNSQVWIHGKEITNFVRIQEMCF